MPSSRPPPSMYPPLPRSVTHLPPFPQLLHFKDENQSPSQGPASGSAEQADSIPTNLSEDEDELDDIPAPSPAGDKGSGSAKKERKPHATRRRVVQSCSECRRRKIKCDKKFPCGPCILRNDQARCHEVGMIKLTILCRNNFATTSELAALAHRLDALEASLVKNGALRPSDLDHFLNILREGEGGSSLPPVSAKRSNSKPVPATGGPQQALAEEETVDDTEGAALTLEHLAFGRSRADGSHSMPHFGSRLSSVSRPAPNNDYHLAKSIVPQQIPSGAFGSGPHGALSPSIATPDAARYGEVSGAKLSLEERAQKIDQLLELLGPTDIFDLFYRKTDVAIIALTRLLPSRQRGEVLVKAYLEKVDWLHRCMHVPTFLRQCNDLWCLPPERVTHEIALPFLGLYLTVCTLGLQFMDQSEINKHFTVEEAHTLPDTWFNAARSALWAADFVGSHTMEALQCIILLGVFMNNRDRADAAWALLGAAIKMAQGLGLSRLGAEQQAVDGKPLPMWTGRWESLIQREVGRRIWWNLVFLDWQLAPSYNFSCSIQPDQIKTALPANIEDEDIIDERPFKPQPISVRTGMSFQLARLKFAEITQRQIWQANNNHHPPYSFILSVDGELRKAMMELPTFFQPDSNTKGPPNQDPKALVQYYEKIMLNLAIHSRMMRLHRPWLSRGYEDERFAYSKEQCIRAARASLRMMSDADGTASFLEKWWLPLFYVSVSGLVVIIDLLRTPRRQMYSRDTDDKISEVKGALDQMRGIMDVSHPARAAVRVMDLLLAEVEDRRQTPGSSLGKRKEHDELDDDESGGLQRAVKKLIRQAQLEADSPNTSFSSSTPDVTRHVSQSPQHSDGTSQNKEKKERESERPVFDAYPMPFNPVQPTITNATTPTPGSGNSSLQPPPHTQPPNSALGQGQGQGQGQQSNQNQDPLQQNSYNNYNNYNMGMGMGMGINPNSPFTFPIDPTGNGTFGTFPSAFEMNQLGNGNGVGGQGGFRNFGTTASGNLDPAVQSMLSNYFPQASNPTSMTQTVGSAALPQAPDDFLSRVFGFGWDGATAGAGAGTGANQSGQGIDQPQGQGQTSNQSKNGENSNNNNNQPPQPNPIQTQGQGQGQNQGQSQGYSADLQTGFGTFGGPGGGGGGQQGWSSHGWMA
uniref:Nuclear protein n=1 Tax=Kwoniella dejecticola CBS 10117 TaxID=1296121 RepID=A0A1A6AB88_9TREE|nr:nuclear protein [Kwoniella dejecticola CBS 10117]OBR87320.1 nuclear protein [Kwoniella dejecticola CBS 10117]